MKVRTTYTTHSWSTTACLLICSMGKMYLLTARHKLIDVLTHLPKDFRHAKSHLVSANVQRKSLQKTGFAPKFAILSRTETQNILLQMFFSNMKERFYLKAIIFRKENGCLLSLPIELDLIGLNQILQKKKFDQS